MPAFLLNILPYLSLASRAPAALADLAKFWQGIRDYFQMLFSGGMITKEQQQALMDWTRQDQEAALRGEVPVSLTVEPDPPAM